MTIICPLPQCGQHWMSMPVKRSMICWRVFNNRHGHHCLDSHQRPDQGDVAVFVTVKDTVQALGSMARESADVTVVVCANHSYRILETELARAGIAKPGPKALALTDLTRPVNYWAGLVKGFGAPACGVGTDGELAGALRRSLTARGPGLVEAAIG